ncbi:MAG TPA: AarF/UbiB family protein [Acidimicrobiales bacterium]|nr:AarF/UbiB family protein [Acidimicrobiales bacterium]
MSAPPPDLAIGAFTDEAPWVVDPSAMTWRRGIDALRARTRAQVPRLMRRQRVPPGRRALRVGASLGWAVGRWYVGARRRGGTESRADLSRRLRDAFERLGPTYIKLGQIISSGEGIFPPELVGQFRTLRDRVRPETFSDVRTVIEADLGRPLESVFSWIEATPVAAASVAQVHRATLCTGERVVVKVQRPTVAELVRKDLMTMSWIAPVLVGRIPVAALANPPALVEVFAETIVEELDFRLEAQNMLDTARILAETGENSAMVVPRPHPDLVTRRVLVMEELTGFAFDDVAGMRAAGIDTEAIIHAGMVAFLEGAMLYGVFHGDLHGGNLTVLPDGRVGLLDHGITGRLDERGRLAFLRLLMAGTINDVRMQLQALCTLGALPPDTDIDLVIRDLRLDAPPLDPTTLTPEQLLGEMQALTRSLLAYGARMPKELMLFVKDLLFLDAAIATLAPDIDLFAEVTRVATHFATRHGERIMADIGIDPRAAAVDLDGLKASMGVALDTPTLTYRELQERRQVIQRRMAAHRRGTAAEAR